MTRQEIKETVFEALNEYFSQHKTVTISEASRILNKSRNTVYSMIRKGLLEAENNQVKLKSIYDYETSRSIRR